MSRLDMAFFICLLIIAIIIGAILCSYANTPVSELPTWVFWLLK